MLLGLSTLITSIANYLLDVNSRHSQQCIIVILAAVANTISFIWNARNITRFQNKSSHWKSGCAPIVSLIALAGNNMIKCSNNDIQDFIILKSFDVSVHPLGNLFVLRFCGAFHLVFG